MCREPCADPDWSAPAVRTAVLAACEAVGPVELSTEEMTGERGFSEGALLDDHVDALARTAGIDRDSRTLWSVSGDALRRLVMTHLVVPLAADGCTVSVSHASRNPAHVCWVNGLSMNEAAIPKRRVRVSGTDVGQALLAVLTGEKAPAEPRYSRPSALEGGLSALLDRRVEVTTIVDTPSTDLLVGRLVAVGDDHLVLARAPYDEPVITVVPKAVVIAVSTYQLTESEDALFD